jgi:hypothetical protein
METEPTVRTCASLIGPALPERKTREMTTKRDIEQVDEADSLRVKVQSAAQVDRVARKVQRRGNASDTRRSGALRKLFDVWDEEDERLTAEQAAAALRGWKAIDRSLSQNRILVRSEFTNPDA